MSPDSSIREEAFPYFIHEASDLLQNIEQDLLSLREDRTSARVHSLMRSAHTLKGASATVGLETVKHVAHVLEDVFRALYNPDIEIDDEVEALLFEGYDCLRMPLMAEINGSGANIDESDIFNRAATIISRLQDKLGALFDRETPIPTAEELGFDVVKSMFEVGVEQRLTALQRLIETGAIADQVAQMSSTCEVFWGLAESLQLPGFGQIAQLTLEGLAAQPQNGALVQRAYVDLRAAQQQVLGGDRSQGGQPSEALLSLVGGPAAAVVAPEAVAPEAVAPEAVAPAVEPGLDLEGSVSRDAALPELGHGLAEGLPEGVDLTRLEGLFGDLSAALAGPLPGRTEVGTASEAMGEPLAPAMEMPPAEEPEGDLAGLFGDLDEAPEATLPDLSAILPPGMSFPSAEPEIAAAEPPEAETSALTSARAIESDIPLASLDDLFGGMASLAIADTISQIDGHAAAEAAAETAAAPTPPSQIAEAAALAIAQVNATPPQLAPAAIERNRAEPTLAPHHPSPLHSPPKAATRIPSNSPVGSKRSRESHVNVRVGLDQILRLDHLVGELLTHQIQSTDQDEQLRQGILELLDQLRSHRRTLSDLQSTSQLIGLDPWQEAHSPRLAEAQAEAQTTSATARSGHLAIPQLPLSEQFDALEIDRYSDLHRFSQKALNEAVQLEIVSEAVAQQAKQNRQTHHARQRLFRQLRDDLASVRLKPVGELFDRFPRVLQQLSTTYGKPVELALLGGHVLIDKVTLDSLYDSLLHLVRNAFDHGIEPPEERQAAGKSPTGRIEISAYQQGNRTVIEIRDDGQGVNLERIAEKAIAQGLISGTEAEPISEAALLEFLFHPGFSTAASVSELSGRGVGLDVVRSQIESLEGLLSIRSEPGKGTSFMLQFPLAMTITKQLICRCDGTTYAIAADSIEQVVLPRGEQLRSLSDGRQLLSLHQGERQSLVPLLPLGQLMQYAHAPLANHNTAAKVLQPILLVACSDGLRGIQVEQVIGEQELSIRAMDTAVTPPSYIQGCTVLGDADLALAIEPSILLEQLSGKSAAAVRSVTLEGHQGGDNAQISEPGSGQGSAPRVLIIDDSLTQRRTLERTLKTVGYNVTQAEDGLDALVKLQQRADVALIICDLEMPRMNGFEFLSQTRSLAGVSEIPIVILTSRSGSKYRQFALELGAAEFLCKPYTDYELLNKAEQLLQAKLGATA